MEQKRTIQRLVSESMSHVDLLHIDLWISCLRQAPAAFGLVSFLMHAGLERNRIRKHLLVFALAAPVLAMLTFLGLSQVNIRKSHVGAGAGG